MLTENLPPFNMAAGGKNFAVDADIRGINADVVREGTVAKIAKRYIGS